LYNLFYSPEADKDLSDIEDYISDELQNPASARKTVVMIANRIGDLRQFPELGASLSGIVDFDCDYRYLVCGSYLAFYRIEDKSVFIDRILYGKRDYIAILFGDALPES
jgi:addiction module RelE/StbE family toxin